MSERDNRSVTPTRRYGDIIGSIFSEAGSVESEERRESCGSEAKRMFRERRQRSSSGRCLRNSTTPERRQQNASPLRRYNERHNNGRPPTPDRSINRSTTPDRDRNRPVSESPSQAQSGKLSTSQIDVFENKGKGISIRALSKSPAKRRANSEIESFNSYVISENQLQKDTIAAETREGSETVRTISSESMQQQKPNHRRKNETSATNREVEREENAMEPDMPFGNPPAIAADEKSTVSFSSNDNSQMKKIIQAQNEQINFFEYRLNTQSAEIEKLKRELQQSKRNEAKLEIELEIHDVKYSMYDDYRRMMDRRRLDGKNEEDDEIDLDFENPQFAKNYAAFSKLERLQKLHEKAKTDAANRYATLQAEYDRVVSEASASKGEKPRDNTNVSSLATNADRTESAAMLLLLEKRIKILESENQRYLNDIQRKQEELDEAKYSRNNSTHGADESESKAQKLETQTLSNKIVALETEIGFTSGQIDNRTRTSRYRALEKNLNEYVIEIMGLEDQLKSKEKIISRLKERELDRNGEPSWKLNPKLYEKVNKRGKTPSSPSAYKSAPRTMFATDRPHNSNRVSASRSEKDGGNTAEDSKELYGEKIGAVSTYINRNIGGNKNIFDSRRISNRKGSSASSTRIAMLRRRLDALATDHSSVCTEETLRSAKTTPHF